MKTTNKSNAVIMADNVPWVNGDVIDYVYGPQRIEVLRAKTNMHPVRITSENLMSELPKLQDVEVIFSCWGMLPLTAEQLDGMPHLKAVFYAAGSVGGFARPFLERGITVCSGVEANACPVAEFCMGQILLSLKGYWTNSAACRAGPWNGSDMPTGPGVYGETVALLGIGAISRHLLKLMRPYHLRIIAVSNYLSLDEAREMGIDELVSIEDAFRSAYVVSNHLADRPTNTDILNREHFAGMRPGATFINTGRGAQVNEAHMSEVLKTRPDLTALLDVMCPEPPEAGSPLFDLPNVHMTSHIAGSTNDEVKRMTDYVIDDFKRWVEGAPLQHAVDVDVVDARA